MSKLFAFKREVSLDTVILGAVTIIPVVIILIQDHYRIAMLEKQGLIDQAVLNRITGNQETTTIRLERISAKLESINWPKTP